MGYYHSTLCMRLQRRLLLLCTFLLIPITVGSDPLPFRIGTGGSEGTYFPIGSLIARAISDTGDAHDGETYHASNLLAFAQRSSGSRVNVEDLSKGLLEAALAQADAVHWAYIGTGHFKDLQPMTNLRTVATLYLESVHLIVRHDSQIKDITDLKSKRVSLDEVGSGTLLNVQLILEAFNLSNDSMDVVYLKTVDAIKRLRENQLDAFFVVAGYPINAVTELVSEGKAKVIPITGPIVDQLAKEVPFFNPDTIPAGTYANDAGIQTLGVGAQLIVNSKLPNELIYNITGMLWSDKTQALLQKGHPKGAEINLDSALIGIEVPLHPGAARFYKEQGLWPDDIARTPGQKQ